MDMTKAVRVPLLLPDTKREYEVQREKLSALNEFLDSPLVSVMGGVMERKLLERQRDAQAAYVELLGERVRRMEADGGSSELTGRVNSLFRFWQTSIIRQRERQASRDGEEATQ